MRIEGGKQKEVPEMALDVSIFNPNNIRLFLGCEGKEGRKKGITVDFVNYRDGNASTINITGIKSPYGKLSLEIYWAHEPSKTEQELVARFFLPDSSLLKKTSRKITEFLTRAGLEVEEWQGDLFEVSLSADSNNKMNIRWKSLLGELVLDEKKDDAIKSIVSNIIFRFSFDGFTIRNLLDTSGNNISIFFPKHGFHDFDEETIKSFFRRNIKVQPPVGFSKKARNFFDQIVGIRGNHLVDPEEMEELAERLDLPNEQDFFKRLRHERLKKIFYSQITNLSTLGILWCLTQPITPENAVYFGALQVLFILSSILSVSKGGMVGTVNSSLLSTHIKTIASESGSLPLGEDKDSLVSSINELAKISSEERVLYTRPIDTILNLILQSLIIVSNSPDKIAPLISVAISIVLAIVQSLYAEKKFLKEQDSYNERERTYIKNPRDELKVKELQKAAREKSKKTPFINSLSQLFQIFVFLTAASDINLGTGGLIATAIYTINSRFRDITSRVFDLATAKSAINAFREEKEKQEDILSRQIITEEDFRAHSNNNNRKLLIPNDLIFYHLKETLLTNLRLVNGKIVRLNLPLDRVVLLFGDNGTGKTLFMDAVTHVVNNHEGDVVLITQNEEGYMSMRNLHDMSLVELRGMFARWNPREYQNARGNFYSLSGFKDFEELEGFIFHEIRYSDPQDIQFIRDKKRIFAADIGKDSQTTGLSEGERRFIMILAFILKSYKEGKRYFFIDELIATMSRYTSLMPLLIKIIFYLQENKGCHFFITIQNEEDLRMFSEIYSMSQGFIYRPEIVNFNNPYINNDYDQETPFLLEREIYAGLILERRKKELKTRTEEELKLPEDKNEFTQRLLNGDFLSVVDLFFVGKKSFSYNSDNIEQSLLKDQESRYKCFYYLITAYSEIASILSIDLGYFIKIYDPNILENFSFSKNEYVKTAFSDFISGRKPRMPSYEELRV